jgi:FG-GAP-like repeat
MKSSRISSILAASFASLVAAQLRAQVVEQVLVLKQSAWVQTSAAAPVIDPSPPGANYPTPPNHGGPYEFSIAVTGTDLGSIAAPTVTLPAGSTYPTQNPVRDNGGVLGYDSADDEWDYGVDADNYSAPTAAERDASFAFGTYGLTVMGTSFNLSFPDTTFHENTPSVTLTGGTWVRGQYLIDVTQPLTITTNVFTNFDKNADGAMTLSVDGVVDQLVFYSDNHAANNFLTYTIPANTLVAGTEYSAQAGFFAVMDRSTAIAGSLNAAAIGANTRFKIAAYSGTLPSGTLHGIGDLPGGINFSVVRAATKTGGVIFATGGSAANPGSTGPDTSIVWTSTGGLRSLTNFASNSTAINVVQGGAITPDGAYIAASLRAGSGGSQRHAARVATNGLTSLDLGTLPGFPQFSSASSISNDGSVLYGLARYEAGGKIQAVRFTASGPTITAIPFLLAGDDTSFVTQNGASSNGSIAVGTSVNSGVDGGDFFGNGNHAFRYVQGTGVSAIPYLAGGTWNSALAISPDGNLALLEGDSPSAPNGEIYLYNSTTAATTALGTPNGSRKPSLAGMTADGSVVAVAFDPADNPTAASYIHNSHGWHDFQTLAGRAGLNTAGWVLDTIFGMSADGTLVWGSGNHNGNTEGWVAEFDPGYLAAADEPATYSTPDQAIVGAWTRGDTTQPSGWAVLVFFANGYYMHIAPNDVGDPTSADGFERGQYTWNAATGELVAHTLLDTGGDSGLSGSDGGAPIIVTVSGNTANANGVYTFTRVTGLSLIVGAFGAANIADGSAALVFLPNGYYVMAQDGDSTPAGDPNGHDGMEWGTYTWNPATGAFTATTLVDTNGEWGLSDPQGPQTVTFSSDRRTLTFTDNSGSSSAPRVGTGAAPVPGDFNGDSQTDLIWENTATGERGIWLMNGSTVVNWAGLPTIPTDWHIAGAGDFNNDGHADIVWENTATGERGIWLMNGSAVVNWAGLPTIPTDWHIVGTGDFNGDGQTDIVWENTVTGERGIWLMNGSAVVNWAGLPTIPTDWHIVGTGDFNGDGQTDIVWENTVTGVRGIWVMNGSAVANWAGLPTVPTDWRIVSTGDFNGDGQTDIVWENTVNGERGIWLMNGSAVVNWAGLPTEPINWHIAR